MPSSGNGSLILPLALWHNEAPDCQITTITLSETGSYIFTGTTSGHIIQWEFTSVDQISPLCLIIGHTGSVCCLVRAGTNKDEEFIVSSSENG